MNPFKMLQFLHNNGITAYLSGGYVRDSVIGVESHDYDIECYGTNYDTLESVLSKLGIPKLTGKRFGVCKITVDNVEFDISLARRDSKNDGKGRGGFDVDVDPTITINEGVQRRDLTINALMMDKDGNIIDLVGGISDIKHHIAKPVGPAFKEDPTRLLRAMRFISKYDLVPHSTLMQYAREMFNDFVNIEPDLVRSEWLKWAETKYARNGLEFLIDSGLSKHYPEFHRILDVEQELQWHPERLCGEHTLQCVDYAATKYNDPIVTLAMLCHDFGKYSTTFTNENGRIVSPGHADPNLGCNQFLDSIGLPNEVKATISELTQYHMHFAEESPSKRSVRRVMSKLDNATIDQLWKVIECDRNGRDSIIGIDNQLQRLIDMQVEVESTDGGIAAKVMGRHLINLGFKPSPKFGPVLDEVYNAQIEHDFDFDVLIQIAIALMTN